MQLVITPPPSPPFPHSCPWRVAGSPQDATVLGQLGIVRRLVLGRVLLKVTQPGELGQAGDP